MNNQWNEQQVLRPAQQQIITAALRMNYKLDPARLAKLIIEAEQKQREINERRGLK